MHRLDRSSSLVLAVGALCMGAPQVSLAAPPPPPGAEASASGSISLGKKGVRAKGDLRFGLDEDGRLQTESGTLSDAIHFETGSAELQSDEETQRALEALATFLRTHPRVQISIDGHTDSRGSVERNHELAQARADSLRTWLEGHGVEAAQLEAHGIGEDAPAVEEPEYCRNVATSRAPKDCEDFWQRNRRVEFVVVAGADTIPKLGGGDCSDDALADGFWKGMYVYLAPAVIGQPIYDNVNQNYRRTSWQGGLGFGYMFQPKGAFRAALGLGAEVMPASYNEVGGCVDPVSGVNLCDGLLESRISAELRLGGGRPRVWGYGLLAPGMAIGRNQDDARVGFVGTVGGGVQGIVGKRGFFLGGEVGFDLMAFTGATADPHPYESGARNMDLKFLLGWHFGWRAEGR